MTYTEPQQETGRKIRELVSDSRYGWHAFYKTKEWDHKRREILQRDHHACVECKRRGRYTQANTVHHIVHLKSAPELALENDNLESLCRDCHEKIHEKENVKKNFWTPERW